MNSLRLFLAAAALAAPVAVSAQDSAVATDFDTARTVTLAGTVSSFDWSDPNCKMTLLVSLPNGNQIAWDLELAAPDELKARGWRASSVKPGNKIQLEINPSLDGSTSGYVLTAKKGNGKPIGKSLNG